MLSLASLLLRLMRLNTPVLPPHPLHIMVYLSADQKARQLQKADLFQNTAVFKYTPI